MNKHLNLLQQRGLTRPSWEQSVSKHWHMHYHKAHVRRVHHSHTCCALAQDERYMDSLYDNQSTHVTHRIQSIQCRRDNGWWRVGGQIRIDRNRRGLIHNLRIHDHSHSLNKDILIVLHNYEQNKDSYKQQSGGVKSSLRC